MIGLGSQFNPPPQPPQIHKSIKDYPLSRCVLVEIEGTEGGALKKRGLCRHGWVELVTNSGKKGEYSIDKWSPKKQGLAGA